MLFKMAAVYSEGCLCLILLYIFSVDAFYEPDDFGILEKVTIGHDNSGYAAGWYFEKVSFTPWICLRDGCTSL